MGHQSKINKVAKEQVISESIDERSFIYKTEISQLSFKCVKQKKPLQDMANILKCALDEVNEAIKEV